ncbi:MAG: glycoside hydrolase family 127 protein [Candidatus Cyclobacteriaceae bacterium M3_2C_046]
MKSSLQFATLGLLLGFSCTERAGKIDQDYQIKPVPFIRVHINNGFWYPRLEANRKITLPTDFDKCETTGRIDNFARAAGRSKGPHQGRRYDDSDVFKVMEGAAYSLALKPDPQLDNYLDSLIQLVGLAQEPDGYLYTMRTVGPISRDAGQERWSYLRHSHELYNVGHMYEAAAAHYQATGKDHFLQIALKNAHLIDSLFGPEDIRDIPGHEEIELGLVKLFRVTGDQQYLDLAKFFIDERGQANNRELYGEYHQDHLPVRQQKEAVGHAVRAGYLYAAMADVAALSGDTTYIPALHNIWNSIVAKRMYITGGIGSRRQGESLGDDFELPNQSAYNETCAAIANALWQHRLFLLTGEAKYMDVFERILYNGFLSGVSINGDEFFYVNPLKSDGVYDFNFGAATRKPWFTTACCPTNVVRFMPSLPGFIYAQKNQEVFVNLFTQNQARLEINGKQVIIDQKTDYPWSGDVMMEIDPESRLSFTLHIRIPGWARNQPVPTDLYDYQDEQQASFIVQVNQEQEITAHDQGFVSFTRDWQAGDQVSIHLDMPIRRITSHSKVTENRNRVAIERGPLVYCREGAVNQNAFFEIMLPDSASFKTNYPEEPGVFLVLEGTGFEKIKDDWSPVQINLIPYYAWSHAGPSKMEVWIKRFD